MKDENKKITIMDFSKIPDYESVMRSVMPVILEQDEAHLEKLIRDIFFERDTEKGEYLGSLMLGMDPDPEVKALIEKINRQATQENSIENRVSFSYAIARFPASGEKIPAELRGKDAPISVLYENGTNNIKRIYIFGYPRYHFYSQGNSPAMGADDKELEGKKIEQCFSFNRSESDLDLLVSEDACTRSAAFTQFLVSLPEFIEKFNKGLSARFGTRKFESGTKIKAPEEIIGKGYVPVIEFYTPENDLDSVYVLGSIGYVHFDTDSKDHDAGAKIKLPHKPRKPSICEYIAGKVLDAVLK